MKKLMIVLMLLGILLISGCTTSTSVGELYSYSGVIAHYEIDHDLMFRVFAICEDGVVCYHYAQAVGGNFDCIKDRILTNKYCNLDNLKEIEE